ncbi:hypothetical protein SETIT_3G312100v2 [Setaria italica]|uniref:Uncharacterized protein n=1 Tax=Setaria italica TaxID=4555 RepID=A0A368QKS5_SETIT|nr:hypothetical protein SETIT_3G312100v2 [Setaria italica]
MHPSQIDRDEVCSWVGILPTQIEDGEVHLRLVRALLHAVDDSEFASISLQVCKSTCNFNASSCRCPLRLRVLVLFICFDSSILLSCMGACYHCTRNLALPVNSCRFRKKLAAFLGSWCLQFLLYAELAAEKHGSARINISACVHGWT